MVFEQDTVHMRVDHAIFEVFRRNRVIGSYRAPPHWVEVRAETRRAGVTRLQVRRAISPVFAPPTT
ncbi:hypothetical protein OH786_34020 [Streptomyces atratus]|uniref:hypothetical protein n=1 Tax=Streptomyces atratus TaxID=1893 RepID=UPI003247937B